jgi:hypothetical protein
MSSQSDTEYSEPFRQIDAKTAASFQRPKPRPLDRVERALNGSLCETELSEDEWDRFAAMRDHSYRNKRDWHLRVSEPRAACLNAPARRRLAAILEHLEWVPHLMIHTVAGRLRVSRQFNTKMDWEIHWFMVEHIRWTVSGESTEDRVSWHVAAFFRISPLVLAVEFPETTDGLSSVATNVCALI